MSDNNKERKYFVYKHTSPSNKVYIGITRMKPEYRWNHGKGYIKNQYFYRAIQKYGWDNFEHEILFEGLTKKEACDREIELISTYNSTNPERGYNVSTGGESGNCGVTLTEEARQKLSEAFRGENNPMFGKHHPEEVRIKIGQNREYLKGKDHPWFGRKLPENIIRILSKNVVQLDKKGKFIAEYNSEMEAERQTGISSAKISLCCNNLRPSAGGFVWILKDKYNSNCDYAYVPKYKVRPVVQLSLDYAFINKFPSIKEAEEATGVSHHIHECCRQKRNFCGGYRWMFEEDYLIWKNKNTEDNDDCNRVV